MQEIRSPPPPEPEDRMNAINPDVNSNALHVSATNLLMNTTNLHYTILTNGIKLSY